MKLGSRLERVIQVDSERFCVIVEWADGRIATVDLTFLFGSPGRRPLVLEILRGDLFGRCFVESGALAWPNGFELCPDAICQWIVRQTRTAA